MAKRLTNEQFVKQIMNFSNFGALSQMFVIDALMQHSKAVAAADPKMFDSALLNGEAWVGVAKEIQQKLEEQYGPETK